MQQKFKALMIAGIFSLIAGTSNAQSSGKNPGWLSNDGYWVAETNVKSPLQHTIWFYNNDNVLVGRKDLSGVKLKIQKRKTRLQLKTALEQSLQAWAARENNKVPAEIATK